MSAEEPECPIQIANLAIQLLATGSAEPPTPERLKAAVKTAKQLLREASEPTSTYAYELFPSDSVMSIEDIAATFKEYGWDKITSKGGVNRRIRGLLSSLFRDIRRRQWIHVAALRRRSHALCAEDGKQRAHTVIKNLLRDLRMDAAFGSKLDPVVDRIWDDFVAAWLKTDRELVKDIERWTPYTPSLFDAICPHSGYDEYFAARRPPENLSAEKLMLVIFWMKSEIPAKLVGESKEIEGLMESLYWLDQWPDTLAPGDLRFSGPFSELISEMEKPASEQNDVREKFDMGIQRFFGLWSRMKLRELALECYPAPAIEALQAIHGKWIGLAPEEQEGIAERLNISPQRLIESLEHFFRGELPYFSQVLPFFGAGVGSSNLWPYNQDLDSLLYALREVGTLAELLHLPADFVPVAKEAVAQEKDHIRELDGNLVSDEALLMPRVNRGRQLIQTAATPFNPGRINPHLLFRYAAERQLDNNYFIRGE